MASLSEKPASFAKSSLAATHHSLRLTIDEDWREFCRVHGQGQDEPTVTFVERLLQEAGTLRALSKAGWSA